MKSKVQKIMRIFERIIFIIIFIVLGKIAYEQFFTQSIEAEVEQFISNYTIGDIVTNNNTNTQNLVELRTNTNNNEEYKTENNNPEGYRFFYNQIENYAKIIYNALYDNKVNMRSGEYEIDLGTQFSELLSKENGEILLKEYYQNAIEAFIYDNPDVFYINFSKLFLNIETTTTRRTTTYKVFINKGEKENYLTDEFQSKEQIDEALSEMEKIRTYFVQNKKENIYDNVKLVHDYIIESVEYDETLSLTNIYNAYGAMINKKGVCEGYAKEFKYLMDGLNIPCVLVSGKGINSRGDTENHAWNYVQINENWYAVDCTWDDPILIGTGLITNYEKHRYFLKGSNDFNKTHVTSGQFTDNGKIFEYPTLNINNY